MYPGSKVVLAYNVTDILPAATLINCYCSFLSAAWCATMQSVDSASSSESDSTEEEERLRRLFSSCDRDGDGYIDRFAYI